MSYEGLANLHLMAKAANYNAWMFGVVRPYVGTRVLEIGAGIGTVTEFLADRPHVTSTEVDDVCLAELSSRFRGRRNVAVRPLDITRVDPETVEELRRTAFDTVLCLNVLEHVRDDVEALANIRTLAPAGSLVLLVPALPRLYGVEDRAVGHFRRYSRRDAAAKLRASGYRIEKILYFNSLGAILWFLTNRVLKGPATTSGNVAFYDRFVVPALSRVERIIRVPFGQSLIIVAQALP